MDRKKASPESALDQMLAAVLQSRGRETPGVLLEMGEISKLLKSAAPDSHTLAAALQRAVAGAVKQCLLERELRSLALTDDLTGLYNRRAFLTLATQQMKLSRRKGKSLLLFFADVDGLKQINDEFGHPTGDLAIVRAAEALERSFRKSDIVARIGGDEFVALAFEASGQSQEGMLRRLRSNLSQTNPPDSRLALSLSVGVAKFDPQQPVSLGDLISRADQAMYEQKRNRSKRG